MSCTPEIAVEQGVQHEAWGYKETRDVRRDMDGRVDAGDAGDASGQALESCATSTVKADGGPWDRTIYTCCKDRCDQDTCASDAFSEETRLCCKKTGCCSNEIYVPEMRACVCDENAHWIGEGGQCRCMDGYVEIEGACVRHLAETCDPVKEVYDAATNTCQCKASAHWEGRAGKCTCAPRYVEIAHRCVASVKGRCDSEKEVYEASTNTCRCKASAHRIGNAGDCICAPGYVEIAAQCVESVEGLCDPQKEVYDASTNTCMCDETRHFVGEAERCACETGYVPIGGKCDMRATCGEHQAYVEASNTCQCEVGFVAQGEVCVPECPKRHEVYDVRRQTCVCPPEYFQLLGYCAAIGDVVVFGHYPQSANRETASPISWQILDVKGDAALLISQYVLEAYPYHDKYEPITWARSNVRSYLNGLGASHNKNGMNHKNNGFIDHAFTASERLRIKKVTNTNANSRWRHDVSGGEDTEDWIFLLSHDEALSYFETDRARVAAPTPYAIHPPAGKGQIYVCEVTCSEDERCSAKACTSDGMSVHTCSRTKCGAYWWLRSPGQTSASVARVNYGGGIGNYNVDLGYRGLRPAMFVYLDM